MTHISTRERLAALLCFAVLALCGALTEGDAFGKKKDVRARIGQNVTHALDAVKATRAQRTQVEASIDEVTRNLEAMFNGARDIDELLTIFSRERIDGRAVEALKSWRDAGERKLADALTRAFYDVHDALNPDQRAQLVDYAYAQTDGRHMRAFKAKVMTGFVSAQIEDALDQLSASAEERAAAHTARDEMIAAIADAQMRQQNALDRLSTIFRGDAVDKPALTAFRLEKEAELRTLTEVFQRALVRVHDAFTAEHRQKLVEMVRARRLRKLRSNSSSSPAAEGFQ